VSLKARFKARPGRNGTQITVEDQLRVRQRQAEVVRLREGDGLTLEEIARRLDVSVSTIIKDLQQVSDRLFAETATLFPRWRVEHVMRVAELHQKLLREFEASKRAKVKRRMQRAVPGKKTGKAGEEEQATTVTEVQIMDEQNETGDPKFLEQAVRASALLGQLLGMIGREAREDDEAPAQPQPGMVSGPIIEVSATALPALPEVRAAIDRAQKRERQRLLKAAPERKEGTR
jgi:transcriptional regulator with XRE-family HTH domain